MTRTVEITLPCHHADIIDRLANPSNAMTFHGPTTKISPWVRDMRTAALERCMEYDLDASGSPLLLGKTVRALVAQKRCTNILFNRVKLLGSDILDISSSWHYCNNRLIANAEIHVNVVSPLRWFAEAFVARKADSQMRAYIDFVTDS